MLSKFIARKYKRSPLPGMAIFLFMLIAVLIFSCAQKREERKIERSFYYWKSVLSLTQFEKQQLDTLHVKTIYLKCFDVGWDEATKQPLPIAKVNLVDIGYLRQKTMQVIPTVFITNECIAKIDPSQTNMLAQKIMQLLRSLIDSANFAAVPEIQIDCDWTASTKEKYFSILKNIKALKPHAQLSATIRLYQIKFLSKTGVPPVDRGLLMCYNMGNLKDPASKNSILETDELKKYIGSLAAYPLPLDVALPLFEWKVLFRNNYYAGLIQNLPDAVFNNSFARKNKNRFEIFKDTILSGYDLKNGDVIRSEQSNAGEVIAAAQEISKRLKNTQLRVSLYHLDSVILSKYSVHELESIYNSLH